MAGVFPMDDVVLDGEGPENMNGHDNFSDDDCIEVRGVNDNPLECSDLCRWTRRSMRRVQTSQH